VSVLPTVRVNRQIPSSALPGASQATPDLVAPIPSEETKHADEIPLNRARARMASNVWFNFAGYAVTLGVTFFVSPLMVHHLGNTAYGVWALVQQFVGYSLLLDFGIRIAVTRFLAQYHARSDQQAIDRLLSTASLIALIPACLIVLCGGVAAYFFPHWFAIPESLVRTSQWSLLLVAVAMAISGPGSLFTACVAAVSRYDLLTLRNSVFVLLRGALLWLFLSMGYGLVAVAVINLVATLVGLAMDVWFTRSEIPGLRVRFSAFEWTTLRQLLHFSLFAFLISIAVRLVYWSDNVVVGAVLGPAAVALYAVGGTMVQYARDAMDNLTRVYAPVSAQMDALGMKEPLQRLYVTGARLGSLAIMPGTISFLITGPAFLALWMGPEFGKKSGPVMIVLSATLFSLPLAGIYSHVLYATNRHRVNGYVALLEAFSNLGLSIWLVHRLGIVGVAWGTLIPATLSQGIIMPIYAARILGVSPRELYDRAVLRPLLAALPSAAWLWFAGNSGWFAHWGSFLWANIVSFVLYALVVWRFVLERDEKTFVIGSLRKIGLAPSVTEQPARSPMP
jgi:O-antigen/teichoic acid export membrane protein